MAGSRGRVAQLGREGENPLQDLHLVRTYRTRYGTVRNKYETIAVSDK